MLHAVIMAGGSGTRFWPASRKLVPKQLLKLSGDRSMIQATSDRLEGLVAPEHRLILTNQILVDAVCQQLPEIPVANVIGEPCKRDTAPCIGLAAAMIAKNDADGIMAVMPSDHVINTPDRFRDAISAAEQLVLEDETKIVTFGIKPTYPAESFGYIERSDAISATGVAAFDVARFREKPDRKTAEEYLASGKFYWNSGIFVWKAKTILDALRTHQCEMYDHLQKIAESMGSDQYQETLNTEFAAIKGTSIDFAVMESYPNVGVIEAPFSWDDVGSWQALQRLNQPDDAGNSVVGSHYGIDTTGSIIYGDPDHTIVTIGVNDLIVVQTADATLVAPKSAEERVREAVKLLEENQRDDCL